MYPTKQSNTQVYSPLGSLVVEQHDSTARCDAINRRYGSDMYGREKGIALAWLLLFVVLVGNSVYNRLGRPEIAATSQADAAVIIGSVGNASNQAKD